jgi:hypothetical protein
MRITIVADIVVPTTGGDWLFDDADNSDHALLTFD